MTKEKREKVHRLVIFIRISNKENGKKKCLPAWFSTPRGLTWHVK